jgi:hypothetical protein
MQWYHDPQTILWLWRIWLEVEMSPLRRKGGADDNRESARKKGGTMEKQSREGNRYYPGMTNEKRMYRSRETGRLYAVSKVPDRGLLILKSEDGLGTAMAHEETIEFHFAEEHRPWTDGMAKPDDLNHSMKID